MLPETRSGVTADRCERCHSLWFDARELDAWLAEVYPAAATPPEARLPRRGVGSRRCPRCRVALETAGWTGLVLDRCPACRGLFVEAREIAELERREPPLEPASFEARLTAALVSGGWALLVANGLARLVFRFWR